MATEIDICNLALGHLGDSATVASISPPEGSAQAEHCSRFYPLARDSLIEAHPWNWATQRVALSSLATGDWPGWLYAYHLPGDCLRVHSVLAAGNVAGPVGQPYVIERQVLASVGSVVLTNTLKPVVVYTARVESPQAFSPLFVIALTWHLAAMLAGPVIKGEAGAVEAKRCSQMMSGYLAQAVQVDANQRQIRREHVVPWTAAR